MWLKNYFDSPVKSVNTYVKVYHMSHLKILSNMTDRGWNKWSETHGDLSRSRVEPWATPCVSLEKQI